ncbi:MAG: hypothetical protein WAM96_03445 [Candidatus Acidiferrales bacterium]
MAEQRGNASESAVKRCRIDSLDLLSWEQEMKPGTDSREAFPLAARVDGKSDNRNKSIRAPENGSILSGFNP